TGESSPVDRSPDSPARPGDVQSHRARPETRINAAEKHVEPRRDDIGDAFSARRLKLRGCRPRGNLQHETAVSLPMRGLVLLVAALSLVACTATPAASPSAPSPTVRVDAGGNVLPPLVDEKTWSDLSSRPPHI